MGKLNNTNKENAKVPALVYALKKRGMGGVLLFKQSKNEIYAPGFTDSALSTIWNNLGQDDVNKASSLVKYRLDYPEFSGEVANYSSEQLKSWALQTVEMLAKRFRQQVLGMTGYSVEEALGWADKVTVAERIAGATASDEEIAQVQTEADARERGETVEQLAAQQLLHATEFRTRRNIIDGRLRKGRDAINNGTTLQNMCDALFAFIEDVISELDETGL